VQSRLPTAAEVERAVATVYTRPEFSHAESPWAPVWRWVARQLAHVETWIRQLRQMEHTNPVLFWIIVGWLVLAGVAILVHLAWTAVQSARSADRVVAEKADARRGRPKTVVDWEEEARRAAAEGRLREAALALYQALVLRLDARGAVRFDPSKTPGDYRREARAHPEAAKALGSFLRGYEPVAFGGRAIDAAGYERLRVTADEAAAHG
jgi:hypothetical protein